MKELSVNRATAFSDKGWYKLKEDPPLKCPACKIILKLKLAKNMRLKLIVISLITISLSLVAMFYIGAGFSLLVIFNSILLVLLVNYVVHKYGELIEDVT